MSHFVIITHCVRRVCGWLWKHYKICKMQIVDDAKNIRTKRHENEPGKSWVKKKRLHTGISPKSQMSLKQHPVALVCIVCLHLGKSQNCKISWFYNAANKKAFILKMTKGMEELSCKKQYQKRDSGEKFPCPLSNFFYFCSLCTAVVCHWRKLLKMSIIKRCI